VRRLVPLLAAATVLVAAPGLSAPARAADVDVRNDRGGDTADLRYRTALTIRGTGFQVVPGGFGGVYVLFGWVDDPRGGSWRPSRGGLTGQDYRYIPDSESAEDSQGYLRYVAFPGGATAGEANAVLAADGSFTVDLTVPGPVFQSVDRQGQVAEIDCREVTCGVITVGAHGVQNARNETFTPVPFGTVYDAAPAPGTTDTNDTTDTTDAPSRSAAPAAPTASPAAVPDDGAPTAAPTPATGGADPTTPPVAGATAAALTVDRATAVQGHALAFSAQGFSPGEQVVAVLDDGVAALGPLTAGVAGDVAGVLSLPADLGVGTHELRLTGAASGTEVLERFPVAEGTTADAEAQVSAVTADTDGTRGGALFLAAAALVFLLAATAFAVTRQRRRAPREAAT
jgi:hypothetical protein